MLKFLATPYWSVCKVFLVGILTLIVSNWSIYGLDWLHVVDVAFLSCIPMLINMLNPKYEGY